MNVFFVAPFLMEGTLRFVAAVAELPGVRAVVVTQDTADLPPGLRSRIAGRVQVPDALDVGAIERAVRDRSREVGPASRLLGVLDQLQEPLAEARARLGLPGMSVDAARNFRDKSRMKDTLARAGVPCARHGLATTASAAVEFARACGFPIVVKPPAGAGARNTFRVATEDGLREILANLPPSAEQPVLLEEFLSGDEHSFDTISLHGRHLWHSLTRYYPSPLEVLENPWIQWCVLLPREVDDPRYDDVRGVVSQALDALGMDTGLSHTEWFRRPDGSVAISEVAARPPGAQFTSLISWAHDVDFYRVWARLVVLESFEPPERRFAAGTAFLRGQGRGDVRAIRGLSQAQRELGPLVVEARLPRPGQKPSGSYEGEGYVILRHPETEVVADGLRKLVSMIRVELGE
jgi:hypothetical protein